jgi:hypothetical protein
MNPTQKERWHPLPSGLPSKLRAKLQHLLHSHRTENFNDELVDMDHVNLSSRSQLSSFPGI